MGEARAIGKRQEARPVMPEGCFLLQAD